ncbi:MAG: DUF697 domain-containing protein [Pararhodobacter sp.]|nr:DUF697 domain-containing protein [Pararhodobacter sp.]
MSTPDQSDHLPRSGPVVIDLGADAEAPDVAAAPPVDPEDTPQGRAMQAAIARMGGGLSLRAKAFWSAALGFLALVLGLAAWDFVATLLTRVPVLGWVAAALLTVLAVLLLIAALAEVAGYRRLRRLDRLRDRAEAVLAAPDLEQAHQLAGDLAALYGGPGARDWRNEILDADAVVDAAEARFLLARDVRATAEIERAARQVALITALVPMALADVAAALLTNLRMIRAIAEIYGGRAGYLGNWRLARAVVMHLLATGVVAVGDDMIGSLAGGGMVSKVSRRFGEGVVNGALTARVGVSAMELCRPLPFRMGRKPRVSAVLGRALQGAFARG